MNIEDLHNFLLNRGWTFVQLGSTPCVLDHKVWHLKTYLPHEEDDKSPCLTVEYIKEYLSTNLVEFLEMEVRGVREGIPYQFRAYHLNDQIIIDNYFSLTTNLLSAYRQIYEIWER